MLFLLTHYYSRSNYVLDKCRNTIVSVNMIEAKLGADTCNICKIDCVIGYGGLTNFHRYARAGDVVQVKKIVQQIDFDLDIQSDDKNTPLAYSVFEDHLEVANILLELGANVNNADHESDTPLHYAVANGNLEMVAKLIEHGSDVCARNDYQITPVFITAYKNYPLILKLLLYNFADPMVCSSSPFLETFSTRELYEKPVSPLYIAVARNSTACVNVLIQAGYEIHKETWLLDGDYPPEDGIPTRFPGSPEDREEYDDDEYDLMFANEENKVKENIALLNDLLSRPPTLLSLSRTLIRKRIGRRLLACVSELGLPKNLQEYLTLADFNTNLASLRSCKYRFDGKFKRFSYGQIWACTRIKTSLSDIS